MGSRTKQTHRGDAWVPGVLTNLFLVAAGAKAPTHETADTAREVARKLQAVLEPQVVSAKRLREHHKWTPAQLREPWAIVLGTQVVVIPKSARRGAVEALKQSAVDIRAIMPQDDEDILDREPEWIPLGNSGRGKPTFRLPSWVKVHVEPKGAEWLKDGLAAAATGGDKREAAIRPSPDTNTLMAYAYDLIRYWTNPDQRRPSLTGAFDQHGELKPVDGPTSTLVESLDADKAGWEEALAVDAQADAEAPAVEPAAATQSKPAKPAGDSVGADA